MSHMPKEISKNSFNFLSRTLWLVDEYKVFNNNFMWEDIFKLLAAFYWPKKSKSLSSY